jgi:hypothetical protein
MRQGAPLGNRNLAKPWFMLARSPAKSGPNSDGSAISLRLNLGLCRSATYLKAGLFTFADWD